MSGELVHSRRKAEAVQCSMNSDTVQLLCKWPNIIWLEYSHYNSILPPYKGLQTTWPPSQWFLLHAGYKRMAVGGAGPAS